MPSSAKFFHTSFNTKFPLHCLQFITELGVPWRLLFFNTASFLMMRNRLGTYGQYVLPTKWDVTFSSSLHTCKLCRTLRKSFIPVRCSTSWKTATSRVGMMAIERVRTTRAKRDHLRFRNPWGEKNTETGYMSGMGKRRRFGEVQEDLRSVGLRSNKRAISSFSSLYQSKQHILPWQTGQNRFLSWWSSVLQPGFPLPRCRVQQAQSNIPKQHPGRGKGERYVVSVNCLDNTQNSNFFFFAI